MLWIPDGFNGFTQDSELVGKWVAEKVGGVYRRGATALGLVRNGQLVVGILYDGYTGVGGSLEMSARCDDPKVTSKWFYWAIFDYPFNQLGVKRCNVLVHEDNKKAIQLDERLGFVRDTEIKDYFPDGNAVLLAMYKKDCKWLKESQDEKTTDIKLLK